MAKAGKKKQPKPKTVAEGRKSRAVPDGPPPGRPILHVFQEAYCEQLIAWMKKGHAFHLFGTTLNPPCCRDVLYAWLDAYPQFSAAKKVGDEFAEAFWTDLMRSGAAGQLKRIKSREPIMNPDDPGKQAVGPDGKGLWREETEPATFNATATIFALKNKFPKSYRDRKELDLGNRKGAGPLRVSGMEPKEAKSFLKKMGAIFSEAAKGDEEGEDE